MGSNTPLLNDYKQEFFWKRFPQSIFGGPKLRLGYDAPAYVYTNQIIIFILPVLLCIGILACGELLPTIAYTILPYVIASLLFVYVLIVNILSAVAQAKKSSIAPILQRGANILSEDDEIMFESCCGIETIEFVIPGKKYKINIIIHALISALIWGMGYLFLLPTNIMTLFGDSLGAAIVLCALGLIVMGIAQYSLTISPPPEWAQFRTIDTYENYSPLMRPFYVAVCGAVNIAAIYYPSEMLLTNQVMHVVFVFLPLMWTIGFLPPLDALFLWLFEQAHTIFFGGSHMASDIRTVIYLLISIIVYIAVYFIPSNLALIIIVSSCGYLLSIDLGGLGFQIYDKCRQNKSETLHIMKKNSVSMLWLWSWKEALFHSFMLILATGTAMGLYYASSSIDSTVFQYLGYVCIALLVIIVVCGEMQSVYVLLGLWRNKIFPSSVSRTKIFTRRKNHLDRLAVFRRIILNFVSPLVIVAFLGGSIQYEQQFSLETVVTDNSTSGLRILDVLGTTRAFRWAWQSSQMCLLEISVAVVLDVILPATSTWSSFSLGLRLLLLGVIRDRLGQLMHKLYLFFTLLLMSWMDKKQRRGSTIPWIVVNLVLFPVVLAIILLACSLSAPLLPLFTLPIIMVGFPRPMRFWPSDVGSSANNNADTVFYKQLVPQMAKALRTTFSSGSMGDPSPGKHFIGRFQDRLIWIHILERGYAYTTVSIKGLELQETSCHTVEATRIDDLIDISYEPTDSIPCCSGNKYPLCTLRPRDATILKTYSDAKNQLTGVIDSPDTLRMIVNGFKQTLVWVLLNHVYKTKREPSIELASRPLSAARNQVVPASNNMLSRESSVWPVKEFHHPDTRPSTAASIHSFGAGSNWSADADSLFGGSPDQNAKKFNIVKAMRDSGKTKAIDSLDDKYELKEQKSGKSDVRSSVKTKSVEPIDERYEGKSDVVQDDVDNLFDELGFGMPAMDINQPQPNVPSSNAEYSKKLPNINEHRTVASTITNVQFNSPYSLQLAPPARWLDIPIDPHKLNSAAKQFPEEWYRKVISLLQFDSSGGGESKCSGNIGAEIAGDEKLKKVYSQLVMAADLIVNVLGISGIDAVSMGAMHVHKVYSGDIPWSPATDWMEQDTLLTNLVRKAYRYAVKLAIEQTIMGGLEFSLDEVQEYMEEFDQKWYIGFDKEPGWTMAIEAGCEQLFSFTYDAVASTFHSRVLSIVDTPVYLSSVNAEAVRAQWANLNMELFYMTNDDEERYSIQAHSTLLRNLTVQAADPPLGYPIYASEPISIPTL